MACFAECHFPHIRRSILSAVKRSLARPKDTAKDVTAAELNRFLRFDTIQEAVAFAELHDLEWAQDPEYPHDVSRQYLVLNSRHALSHPRLSHQFSQSLVEKKRGSRSLPEIIHESTFEDPRAAQSAVQKPIQEDGLFVEDKPPQASPFSTFSKPAAPSIEPSSTAPQSIFAPSKGEGSLLITLPISFGSPWSNSCYPFQLGHTQHLQLNMITNPVLNNSLAICDKPFWQPLGHNSIEATTFLHLTNTFISREPLLLFHQTTRAAIEERLYATHGNTFFV
jgi:hypothetical protein